MNKIIALLALTVAANFAQAETILAEVRDVSTTIQTVQLTSTGLLKIVNANNVASVLPLSQANSTKLIASAQELSGAKITVEHHQFICMMIMVGASSQDLYVAQGSTDDLKLVDSATGCQLQQVSYPADPSALRIAQTLKAQMVALAEQLSQ